MSEQLSAEEVPTGGTAFPAMSNLPADRGMNLRDYFAGQALVAMRAHPANEEPVGVASWCYHVADAMLKARGTP